jgi:hypothetical protein
LSGWSQYIITEQLERKPGAEDFRRQGQILTEFAAIEAFVEWVFS